MANVRWKAIWARYETLELTETVVYVPLDGRSRDLQALVDREGDVEMAGAQGARMLITVLNDPLLGVDVVNDLHPGRDRIKVALIRGRTRTERTILKIHPGDDDGQTVTLVVD